MKKINSDFAILDVKSGRASLARRIKSGQVINVVIRGTISSARSIGNDDGVSIEFSVDVTSAEEVTP